MLCENKQNEKLEVMKYQLLPLVITVTIAVAGWIVGHYLTSKRDRRNHLLDLRTKYLMEVYRKLERAVGNDVNEEIVNDLETALADLQLLGSVEQVERACIMIKKFSGNQPRLELGDILSELRKSIRRDLNLDTVDNQIEHLRITVANSKNASNTVPNNR